ncbi:MAG: polysaccharide lyase family 8 super-sandwich domain-containing protein, partial [Chitinophagaceae bacterium]
MYTRNKGDDALKNKILSGLNYWFKNDFICPNWWYPQIGVPKVLGPTMILMEKDLSAEQKAAGLKILDRAKIGMTGQNKVWLSGNVLYKGLLLDSFEMVKAAVAAIQSEIVISQGEGIQPDFSFHQHGPQQQFGNYGASFAEDMLKWATILKPTDFHFPEQKIQILRDYLIHGMKWIIWNNQMDISACGRQLFPGAQLGKAKMIKNIFGHMATIDPMLKNEYEKSMSNFAGDKFFWRSDMVIHRQKDFYTSVKMCSSRVGGAESCNDENISGYHLGDGANYFYQSGNEYTDIFPFWDWKRIPGTTTFHDEAPLPVLPCSGYRINSDFVGGMDGIATMAYNRDSLVAQKSWFFFDDITVCLGAGISSTETKEVNTTINQSFLHGDVQVNDGPSTQLVRNGMHNLKDIFWIIHDNWAYIFPQKTSVELSNREQTGDWHKVVKRMPSKEIRAEIFTLSINHHKQPKDAGYAYFVLPKANPASIRTRSNAISIIENSRSVQAVENTKTKFAKIVFFKAATIKTKSLGSITANQPCVVTLGAGKEMALSYSDPSHAQ